MYSMFSFSCRGSVQLHNILHLNILNQAHFEKQCRFIQNKYSHTNTSAFSVQTTLSNHKNNNDFPVKIQPCYYKHLTSRNYQTMDNPEKKHLSENVNSFKVNDFKDRIQEDLLQTEIMKNKSLSVKQWDKLRNVTLTSGEVINENNVDGLIMTLCMKFRSFSTAKSYFQYINSTSKKFNLAFIGNYMKFCYLSRTLCKAEDINVIETLYTDYIRKYPFLDANSAENVILGISLTKYWTDYKKYFDMIWTSCSPGIKIYSAVVEAAFLNKEYEIGWQLLKELGNYGKNPIENVFVVWLDIVEKENSISYLEKMLFHLADYDAKLSKDITIKIKQEFERINKNETHGVLTSVTNRGVCKHCRQQLPAVNVTHAEFEQLKTAFLNPVLIGRDIFVKTRPEELNSYQKLLKETAPFDVVLDGLNIAYSAGLKNKTPSTYSFMVKSVVEHFAKQSKKILLLGRKHMNYWPKHNMQFVEMKATMFLAEDMSDDDPFLLYAALYSGPKTDFVSRDLMRGHKFLLSDVTLQSIFRRWQIQHQVFMNHVGNDGKVYFTPPVLYRQTAQRALDGSWHIPYDAGGHDDKVQPDKRQLKLKTFKSSIDQLGWLCLR